MSLDAITTKRVRRTWEPEQKAWHDDALTVPWDLLEPPLHKAVLFSLKNVFFFSHATAVQAMTTAVLGQPGNSAVVEAPTGSGKTLAFLVPMMERVVRACDDYVAVHQRPPLTRNILGVILSPSRALAEQTFVVGRNLAARCPYSVHFALCDGVVETAESVLHHLSQCSRGAGTVLVTTPKDLESLLPLLEGEANMKTTQVSAEVAALLEGQSEETRRRYEEKLKRRAAEAEAAAGGGAENNDNRVCFTTDMLRRFFVVVDEADLVFNSPEMRAAVMAFFDKYCSGAPAVSAEKEPSAAKKGKKGKKTPVKKEQAKVTKATSLVTDFAFVGATVATSDLLRSYAEKVCEQNETKLHTLTSHPSNDFVQQLNNRYVVCDAQDFLPTLIQLMNIHASRKHFVFFNDYRVLQFVQKLFSQLCQGARPLLYLKHIYVMYEGMTESAKIEQYNGFLTHRPKCGADEHGPPRKRFAGESEKKNQVFQGGWKRDGKVSMGTGAVLLCTDIAAFGLDVRDVDYVYHFEPPASVRSYIHRTGRVGRMGMRGTSLLVLPCIANTETLVATRERKTTSTRYNTATNTKGATGDLNTTRVSVESLSDERRSYVSELGEHIKLAEYMIPPFAPITSTLRNIISQDDKLVKAAKKAAMALCGTANKEDEASWFTPKLALRSLVLD